MTQHIGERFGHYRLIRFLGEGTFGDVYYGEHVSKKTSAAIKVFKNKLTPDKFKSFLNEVRTVLLKHPNIVEILDFGVGDNDLPYLVMAYAPHGTLLQRHARGTPLAITTVVAYVKQLASALQYAHDQSIIHRDVKPENMLFGPNDELLLSDFGLAVVVHSTLSRPAEDKSGTALYMAPEQWQGKPLPATDQYALGMVVYEWLCGEHPFSGGVLQLMYQHLHVSPPSLRDKLTTISSEVEQVVMTALTKDPGQRFKRVQAFAIALEEASKSGSPLTPKSAIILPRSATPPAPTGQQKQETNYPVIAYPQTVPFAGGVVAGGEAPATDNAPHPKSTRNAVPSTPVLPGAKDRPAPASSAPPTANMPLSGASTVQTNATNVPNGENNPNPTSGSGLPPKHPRITGDSTKAAPAAPVPSLQAAPVSRARASRQKNSVRMEAIGSAAGDVGGIVAGRASPSGNLPPLGTPSGTGRLNGSQGRRQLGWLLVLALLLLSLLLCSGVAFALPKQTQEMTANLTRMMSNLVNPQASSPTMVTITPASQVVQSSYSIQAVISGASATQHQVAARILTANPSQQKMVTATGHVNKVTAAPAKGVVTFTNSSNAPYTYGTSTPIVGNGVTFYLDAPVTIPAANPGVSFGTATGTVTAATPGSNGNIGSGIINIQGQFITITNKAAFTGGQDAKDYHFLQQSDFDSVASPLKAAILAQAKSAVQSQIRSTERVARALQCSSPTATADQPIGDTGVNVTSATVTASASCSQEVYDQQGLQGLVEGLLKAKTGADPHLAGYALVGSIVTETKVQGVDSNNTVTLAVTAKGMWVYQVDKTALARLIVGLSAQQASAKLKSQPGVADVGIPADITSFPTDVTKIPITIVAVPGFSAGGSS